MRIDVRPRFQKAPRPAWKVADAMNHKERLAFWAAATRTCERCGTVFGRKDKPGVIFAAFMRLRFCSPGCAAAALRLDPVANFWSKVDKSGECWIWTGRLSPKGYGVHWIGRGHKRAHRYSYFLATGNDPGGLVVMHKCDNRSCVNPDHLEIGTQADNVADMDSKGRRGALGGSDHPSTSLTPEQVLAIRRDSRPASQIAAEYPVGKSGVEAIKARRTWKSLP